MKIYVVGSSKNKFLPLDNIREKFLIDKPHEGDNIDFLNPWYCELTGLYYLWKHVDDEIVGLEHYRRYFVNNKGKLLSEKEINELLTEIDVLCPIQFNKRNEWYCNPEIMLFGKTSYLSKMPNAVKHALFFIRKNNEDFWDFVKNIWLNKKYIMSNNMFICKKEIINEYCTYIFSSLFEANEYYKYDLNKNTKRIYGYITECLFGAWLEYKNYKVQKGKIKFICK